MTITYQVKNAIYVNITNRCPCACKFCLRQHGPGVYGSGSLWLEREPAVEEIVADLDKRDWNTYKEVVFCGYGEPTERLADMLMVCAWMKAAHPDVKIRVNTNGLSDLINNRRTAPFFANKVDVLSISLNTDDPNDYFILCRPRFGRDSYQAMLNFAVDAKSFVPQVVMTIVGEPVTPFEKQANCRTICENLGLALRIRPYEAG